MTDSMTISKLAEAYRAVEEERKREYEAALKLAVEKEWEPLRAKVDGILTPEVSPLLLLKGIYTPNSEAEWRRTKQAIKSWRIEATPKDLPDGVSITLVGRLEPEYQGERLRLGLHDPAMYGGGIMLAAGQSSDEQAHALASLVLPEIERQQQAAAEKAERERREQEQQRAWAERRRAEEERERQREQAIAAAKARLAERIPLVREALEIRREKDLTERGWPEAATLTLYHILWVAAVDPEGYDRSYDWYSPYSVPDTDGWWQVLRSDGMQCLRVESPNGYLVQELVITDARRLPQNWMYQEQGYAMEISEPLPDGITSAWGQDRVWEHVEIEPTRLLHPLIVELVRKRNALQGQEEDE